MPNTVTRKIIAVVTAGVAGAIANALAAAVISGAYKLDLLFVPGRYLVAIACTSLLPFIYHALKPPQADWSAFVALIVIPSMMAKFIFSTGAPWSMVIALNAVYAIAACAVYREALTAKA